mgnify:CR=1 FL=1
MTALAVVSYGSSPLARGLPYRLRRMIREGRIIPARAGFTQKDGFNVRMNGDHPRSRGVYGQPVTHEMECAGSSPLARGLLVGALPLRRPLGIIPARAGFTICC